MSNAGAAGRALKPAMLALMLGLTPTLGACTFMPHEHARPPAMPAGWRDAPVGANVQLADWWTDFNDPLLNQLVTEALHDGPSLQLAAYRVQEARAVSHSTVAANLPDFTIQGSANYEEVLRHTPLLPSAGGGFETGQALSSTLGS